MCIFSLDSLRELYDHLNFDDIKNFAMCSRYIRQVILQIYYAKMRRGYGSELIPRTVEYTKMIDEMCINHNNLWQIVDIGTYSYIVLRNGVKVMGDPKMGFRFYDSKYLIIAGTNGSRYIEVKLLSNMLTIFIKYLVPTEFFYRKRVHSISSDGRCITLRMNNVEGDPAGFYTKQYILTRYIFNGSEYVYDSEEDPITDPPYPMSITLNMNECNVVFKSSMECEMPFMNSEFKLIKNGVEKSILLDRSFNFVEGRGRHLILVNDNELCIYDIDKEKIVKDITHDYNHLAAVSKNGDRVVLCNATFIEYLQQCPIGDGIDQRYEIMEGDPSGDDQD